MKKVIIISLLFTVPFQICFAGIFYSNIVVTSTEKEPLEKVLSELDVTAYYTFQNSQGVIYEKTIDTQDILYGRKLSRELSEKLNTVTVYTTNHDSDVLFVYIFKNGRMLFAYNSNPGYFSGDDLLPEIIDMDVLLDEFTDVEKEALIHVLRSEEIFVEEIHWGLCDLFGLPVYSIGLGYDYLNYVEDNEMAEIEKEFNIQFEKTEK